MKVLIVEDDEDILNILHEIICTKHDCTKVSTVGMARQAIRKERFDLILLDLIMYGGNATALISYIRELYYPSPRIVLMSAMTGAAKIAQENAVEFLAKPFDLDYLESLIN